MCVVCNLQYQFSVGFVNGHRHSAATAAAYGNVSQWLSGAPPWIVPLQDVPSVASVTFLGAAQDRPVGVGGVITVLVTAAWAEAGLLPLLSHCCVINGVNVSQSFADVGNGSYTLTYAVSSGDVSVTMAPPSLQIALVDAAHGQVSSDVVVQV